MSTVNATSNVPSNTTAASTITVTDIIGYDPNQKVSIAALICFIAATILTFIWCTRYHRRKWWILFWLPATFAAESFGFYFRYQVHSDLSFNNFIGFYLLILIAPNGLALVNYSVASKLMYYQTGESTWMSCLFVCSDLFTFVAFLIGGVMQGSDGGQTTGRTICVVGLVTQLVCLAIYSIILIRLHRSYKSYPVLRESQTAPSNNDAEVEAVTIDNMPVTTLTPAQYGPIFNCLYITTALLFLRSVYRFLETSVATVGRSEAAFVVCDTVLILLMFAVYLWLLPTKFLATSDDTQKQMPAKELHRTSSISPTDINMVDSINADFSANVRYTT